MKNKVIFVLVFLISVVSVRILMLKFLNMDLSPILVALIFLIFQRDKFSLLGFKLFNPQPFITIIAISYVIIFLGVIIQTYFNLSSFSISSGGQILIYFLIALILGLIEEPAWRGYLFSKLEDLTWLQITITINLVWSIWHIPTHYKILEGHLWISYPLFIISCFELGIIMQYLRVKTNSVIPSILFHAFYMIPLMSLGLKTKVLYWGSFPYIIIILLLIPLTVYCYKAGEKIHKIKKQQNSKTS